MHARSRSWRLPTDVDSAVRQSISEDVHVLRSPTQRALATRRTGIDRGTEAWACRRALGEIVVRRNLATELLARSRLRVSECTLSRATIVGRNFEMLGDHPLSIDLIRRLLGREKDSPLSVEGAPKRTGHVANVFRVLRKDERWSAGESGRQSQIRIQYPSPAAVRLRHRHRNFVLEPDTRRCAPCPVLTCQHSHGSAAAEHCVVEAERSAKRLVNHERAIVRVPEITRKHRDRPAIVRPADPGSRQEAHSHRRGPP